MAQETKNQFDLLASIYKEEGQTVEQMTRQTRHIIKDTNTYMGPLKDGLEEELFINFIINIIVYIKLYFKLYFKV